MQRTSTTIACAAVACVALAGCGSSTDSVATPTTTPVATPSASTAVPATTTESVAPTSSSSPMTTTTPTSPVRCSAADITPSLGTVPAPGKQIIVPLYYTNSGSAPCTLVGYPGATLQGPEYPVDGPQYQLHRSITVTPTTITLNPGQKAVADLTLGTVATTDPSGWQATALLTIAPDDTTVMTVPFPAGTPILRQDGATRPATYVGLFTGPVS